MNSYTTVWIETNSSFYRDLQAKTGRQTMCFQSILPSKREIKTLIHGNEWRQRQWWLITLPVALLGPNWTTRIDPYANGYYWMCLVLSKLHWESRHNNHMIVGGSNGRYYGEDARLGRRWWCAHSQRWQRQAPCQRRRAPCQRHNNKGPIDSLGATVPQAE